jgi:hypothetical protein
MIRTLIIFSFLLSISYGYSQGKAIIGHWVQEKLEYQIEKDKVVNENTTSQRWVIFEKNNTLKHGLYPDQISNTGTWEYDKKNKQIIIFFYNSIKPEGDKIIWELIKLNKNEMIVGGNYPYVHFRKIKK